jgi:replication-associated recombination protein RarA
MQNLLHPDDLIRRLRLNKHRCFIITGRPGEGKTRLAKALAARTGGQYLDLLGLFAADPQRAATLDTFTPQHFKTFLQDFYGDLVLVDEMEFLWHRWDDREKQAFLTILARMPKQAFFGVFLPPDPILQTVPMVDQDGLPRIFSLHELQSLS